MAQVIRCIICFGCFGDGGLFEPCSIYSPVIFSIFLTCVEHTRYIGVYLFDLCRRLHWLFIFNGVAMRSEELETLSSGGLCIVAVGVRKLELFYGTGRRVISEARLNLGEQALNV